MVPWLKFEPITVSNAFLGWNLSASLVSTYLFQFSNHPHSNLTPSSLYFPQKSNNFSAKTWWLEDYIYFPFVMIPFQGGHLIFVVGCGCWKKTPSFTPSPLSTLTLLHLHLRHASGRQGYTVGSHRTCHAIGWPRLCLQRCRHRARTGPRLHGIGAIGIHLREDGGWDRKAACRWWFSHGKGGKGKRSRVVLV